MSTSTDMSKMVKVRHLTKALHQQNMQGRYSALNNNTNNYISQPNDQNLHLSEADPNEDNI